MAKKRERTEGEFLRGENRKLKSQVRNLKKQVSRLEKRPILEPIDNSEEIEKEFVRAAPRPRCPECNELLEIVDIGTRQLHICECGYRKSQGKNG